METSDDNIDRIYKQAVPKIHSYQISHIGEKTVIFVMTAKDFRNKSYTNLKKLSRNYIKCAGIVMKM